MQMMHSSTNRHPKRIRSSFRLQSDVGSLPGGVSWCFTVICGWQHLRLKGGVEIGLNLRLAIRRIEVERGKGGRTQSPFLLSFCFGSVLACMWFRCIWMMGRSGRGFPGMPCSRLEIKLAFCQEGGPKLANLLRHTRCTLKW